MEKNGRNGPRKITDPNPMLKKQKGIRKNKELVLMFISGAHKSIRQCSKSGVTKIQITIEVRKGNGL